MAVNHILLGQSGEQVAVDFLKKNGYKILGRHWQAGRFGEIDIISRDYSSAPKIFGWTCRLLINKNRAPIVFVEVKAKSDYSFGLPEEELTQTKKQKIRRAVQDWFWQNKLETANWRIDLVAVDFSANKNQPEIRHYRGLV